MGLSHSPTIVTDGLVLCLDAANSRSYPKSGTTWSDLAGANNGTLTNMDASNFNEANGGSLSFDGSNEYINCGSPSLDINDGYTLISWFKISTLSNALIINMDSSSSPNERFFQFRVWGGKFEFIRFNSSNGYLGSLISSTSLVSGVWYNILSSFDSSEGEKIYVNSVLDATSSRQTQNKSGSGTILSIGCRYSQGGVNDFFSGDISVVQIYDRALTADEIRQNYLATKGRYE